MPDHAYMEMGLYSFVKQMNRKEINERSDVTVKIWGDAQTLTVIV